MRKDSLPFDTSWISIYGCLFLCLNAVFFGYLVTSTEVAWWLTREDSWIENLTAVQLLLGGIFLLAMALMERKAFRRLVWGMGGVALICAAGEEISWGQRIFGFSTPDMLREINAQKEFSLHNIYYPIRMVDITTPIMRNGTALLCITSVVASLYGKDSLFGFFRLPLPLAVGLVVGLTLQHRGGYAAYFFQTPGIVLTIVLIHVFFTRSYGLLLLALTAITSVLAFSYMNNVSPYSQYRPECIEYMISFGYCLYALIVFRAQRRPSSLSPTPRRKRSRFWARPWGGEGSNSTGSAIVQRIPVLLFLASCGFVICISLGGAGLVYEQIYSITVSRKPHVRSVFDIYIVSRKPEARSTSEIYISDKISLIYTKEPCTPSDIEADFFLHVYPTRKRVFSNAGGNASFENKDFFFSDHGKLFDDKCMATMRLPTYDISRIETGQYTPGTIFWKVAVPLH